MVDPHPTRTTLLQLVRSRGRVTLAELQRATGLSRSALRQHLTLLERDGLVQERLERGRTGRPPIIFEPAPETARGSPESFASLLTAVFRAMRTQAPGDRRRVVEAVAAEVATQHADVAHLPDPTARIRAALAALVDDPALIDVHPWGPYYRVVIHACPLVSAAREFPELCDISRRLLRELVGARVEQQASIAHGDDHCVFLVKARQPTVQTPVRRVGHG